MSNFFKSNPSGKPLSSKTKVVALSVGQGVAGLINLATMIIMARVLSEADLATFRQTLLVFMFVGPILQLGIGQGIYYFLAKETDRIRGRVVDAIVVLVSMGLLFGLFIALGGNQLLAKQFSNPEIAPLLIWMIPLALVALPSKQIAPVLVVRERVILSSVFGTTSQFMIGVCTVVPLMIWQNPQAPLIGYVISGVLMGLVAITIMISVTPADSLQPSLSGIKEIVIFSVPLGISGMIGTISMQLSNVIAALTSSPREFAIFSIGARELPLISIVTGSITAVLMSDMVKSFSRNEPQKALTLWKLAATKASLLLFPTTIFLMAFAEEFMVLLFSEKYVESAGVFRVFLGMLFLRVFSFGSILVSAGAGVFVLWRTIVWAVSSLCLSFYFINLFGIIGIAWATLLTQYLLAAPLNFWKIHKLTDCPYLKLIPLKKLGLVLFLSVLPLFAAFPSRFFISSPLSFVICGGIYGILLAVLYNLSGLVRFEEIFKIVKND